MRLPPINCCLLRDAKLRGIRAFVIILKKEKQKWDRKKKKKKGEINNTPYASKKKNLSPDSKSAVDSLKA